MGIEKFVVTSAQAMAKPNMKFLKSLEHYCNMNNADLIVLPMIGKDAKQDSIDSNFHPKILELGLTRDVYKLNKNIGVDHFNLRPQQVDPITGLQRFAQRGQTKIFAAPKQRWKYFPHSNQQIPKALITTGALTEPNYATGADVSAERRRLGGIAKRDHEYGAIVVEVVNGNIYHWRNLLSQVNGKFTDMGTLYDGDKTSHVKPLVMSAGDWHTGYSDPVARQATLDMIVDLEPQKIFLHDFFDGHSVSHHTQQQLIYQWIREGADKGNLSLEREFDMCYNELNSIDDVMKSGEIVVVQSNHMEFLDRYLDEGRFIKDPGNARMAFKLASLYVDGLNPVEEGMKMSGEIPDNVTFLDRWSDYKVKGFQLANHGDNGPGYRGFSILAKEAVYGKSITGHCHTSEKLRQTYTNGSILPFDMFYLKGSPISWTQSHNFIYDTGVQTVNIIKGDYKAK